MSRIPGEDDQEKKRMALSYASDVPTGRTQTLPSFKELLPSYLHEEIDSASFFPQSRQGLPGAGASAQQGSLSPNRATSGPSQTQSPLSPLGNDRAPDFSSASRGPSSYHRTGGALHSPPADNSLPAALSGPTSQFNSRGPSPILPPIRDLHSLSDRNLKRLGTNPEDNLGSRPSSFVSNFPSASREAGYAYGSTPLSAREEERPGGSQPFAGGGAPQAYYNQPPYESSHYVHYPGTHSNESNYSPNVQTSPPSNFGVMSDPMDSRSRRRRGNLPKPVTDILRAWFHEHLDHPYPSEEDKQIFMSRTGLSISQISNWFINARRRQLPALRNQIRNNEGDRGRRSGSPESDIEQASSPASGSSPPR